MANREMNYFAHAKMVLSAGRPMLTAGTILPDLIRYAGARRTHRVPPWLEDRASAERRDIALGIANHIEADAAFHTSDAFLCVQHGLTRFVRTEAVALADHWTRWLLPHLVSELVLDRLLVRSDPEGVDAAHDAIGRFRASAVFEPLCGWYRVDSLVAAAVLDQWVAKRRLWGYDTLEGLKTAVERTLSRHGRKVIAPDEEDAFARLINRAEELIGDPYLLLPSMQPS